MKHGIRELILKAFSSSKTELSSEEIFRRVSRAGFSSHGIRSITHRLFKEGAIERTDRATYRIAKVSTGKRIANAVLALGKEFTSADVARASRASGRQTRRTLLELTRQKAIKREGTVYNVISRAKVRLYK